MLVFFSQYFGQYFSMLVCIQTNILKIKQPCSHALSYSHRNVNTETHTKRTQTEMRILRRARALAYLNAIHCCKLVEISR